MFVPVLVVPLLLWTTVVCRLDLMCNPVGTVGTWKLEGRFELICIE